MLAPSRPHAVPSGPAAPAHAGPAALAAVASPLKRGWVYVVEDVEPARRHAQACLRRLGWRVFLFPDAQACMDALAHFVPEAVLLDIGLPDRSGLVLAGRLRRRFPGLRLVAYTGLAADDRAGLADAAFDGLVAKPGLPADFERLLPPPGVDATLPGARP